MTIDRIIRLLRRPHHRARRLHQKLSNRNKTPAPANPTPQPI
jgi:hypothetical protein